MRDVQISEDALEDLNNGQLFYEAQEPGLGEYFTACLRADIEGLRVSAGVHGVVYHDYHRLLSRVFPYGIFYTIEPERAVVWAVIDLRRSSEWIRQRLVDQDRTSGWSQ
ncbi:MAG TPA: type II toxin-antitoxin system RelE/ParE family toxin [Candidatus Paceibacterota bacterium]|nr:type II toxin-antitoxin system RelE/ParE family toxin [Verrucomicrobiota bacterium]HRY51300.1 type II toxin-antitoxin system RelE/ParE family toxin [Candidatus Paceibacterota bacterium]HSA03539.1 type II toxin-antitoxin system RelE/ParE family toxin [Candidatus Paceibacterota bacterium]